MHEQLPTDWFADFSF